MNHFSKLNTAIYENISPYEHMWFKIIN